MIRTGRIIQQSRQLVNLLSPPTAAPLPARRRFKAPEPDSERRELPATDPADLASDPDGADNDEVEDDDADEDEDEEYDQDPPHGEDGDSVSAGADDWSGDEDAED